MNKTSIEYLTHTWNPIAMKCDPVSPGCAHCWHLSMANRMTKNPKMPMLARAAYAGESGPVLLESRLDEPKRRKKPSIIGVQFMGDLFHEEIAYGLVEQVLKMIDATDQHTYLLLTKRPKRMYTALTAYTQMFNHGEPIPNLWLGVTAENQAMADKRIPILLHIPAVVHFVSIEPMLGPIIVQGGNVPSDPAGPWPDDPLHSREYLRGICGDRRIDWVIAGAETGPGARPMDLAWARSIRDQCLAAGVAFFFKRDSAGSQELDGKIWHQFPEVENEYSD